MAAKEIKIGDTTVKMLATGATPIFYKDLFNEDLIVLINEGVTPDGDVVLPFDRISQLGFILAKEGEGLEVEEMNQLSWEDYIRWAKKFQFDDLIKAGPYILMTLSNSQKNDVELKKTTEKE